MSLSYGNRVMKTELSFAKQPFCYGFHNFWVMSYGNWELSYGNNQSKPPLKNCNIKKEKLGDVGY